MSAGCEYMFSLKKLKDKAMHIWITSITRLKNFELRTLQFPSNGVPSLLELP